MRFFWVRFNHLPCRVGNDAYGLAGWDETPAIQATGRLEILLLLREMHLRSTAKDAWGEVHLRGISTDAWGEGAPAGHDYSFPGAPRSDSSFPLASRFSTGQIDKAHDLYGGRDGLAENGTVSDRGHTSRDICLLVFLSRALPSLADNEVGTKRKANAKCQAK